MNVIEEIKQDVSGVALLADWLGADGLPVDRIFAERRAYVCQLCPHNRPGKPWEAIKHSAAMWIRGELELKHKLDLQLPNEELLGMCEACGCCNRLKCWTPIKHIKNHLTPHALSKLDKACWIRTEMS